MFTKKRGLSWAGVAVGLTSLHYGVGFVLGTGEATYTSGARGALYGIAAAVGTLALVVVTRLYWIKRYPLWIILGKKYGSGVENLVSVLSWMWMIGLVASQVLGGAFILSILGVPPIAGIWVLAITVNVLALFGFDKLSKVFFLTLLLSSVSMLFIVFYSFGGITTYLETFRDFTESLPNIFWGDLVGIGVTTILLTMLGMDFHQFVVQGKSIGQSIKGETVAFLSLGFLAFLPATLVQAGRGLISQPLLDPKQALPFVLMTEGDKLIDGFGGALVGTMALAALGSGIGVAKIMNRTLQDFTFLNPKYRDNRFSLICGVFIVGLLAMFGKSIISLIVSFYAIYVAGVAIPFLAFVLEEKGIIKFSKKQVYNSLLWGGVASTFVVLMVQFVVRDLKVGAEFVTISVGIFASLVGLLIPHTQVAPRR